MCSYLIQPIPDSSDVKFVQRSSSYKKDVNLKSKTPKPNAKAVPNSKPVSGSMEPCKHCAKQAVDAIAARRQLSAEQHKSNALEKSLESLKKKADATAAVC